MAKDSDLQIGQAVWFEDRKTKTGEMCANGHIVSIDEDEDYVLVKFGEDYVELTFDDFRGKWTDSFGGVWMFWEGMW